MEKNESKAKYAGELAAVVFLEMIMLLFRLVQPIRWPGQLPAGVQAAGNEFVYFGIEFILIIVIVGHFIFKKSYGELGLSPFKENIGSLVLNLCFTAVCISAAFFTSQFSKVVEVNLAQVILQVVTNFAAIAFIKELIFRGFLFNSILKLTDGKGILTSAVTAFLFALSYIPDILINLNEISAGAVVVSLAGPFIFGLYLSILYYYSKNLWICTIIHGTALTFTIVEPDFFMTALAGLYGLGLVIYLAVKIRNYYKQDDEEDEAEEAEDLAIKDEVEAENLGLEDKTKEPVSEITEEDILAEVNQDEREQETEQLEDSLIQDIKETAEEEAETSLMPENRIIEIPAFKAEEPLNGKEESYVKEDEKEHADKIISSLKEDETEEEDDLKKASFIPNTKEELGKVVNLQARKEQLVRKGRKDINFDDTLIIPCITERSDKEERSNAFKPKSSSKGMEAEPNYIAHLEECLGEFEGIYKQTEPTNPPIDVMYFANDRYHALVTNGMRALEMNIPSELSEYSRAELMMFIDPSMLDLEKGLQSEENAWLIKLLTDLALYPRDTGSYLGWGHIVGNGEHLDVYDESVEYCGALIYPPLDQNDIRFYRYEEKGQGIYIYNVMPLYKEELIFIQEHSGDQFINLMKEMGIKQSIIRNRINVIRALEKK